MRDWSTCIRVSEHSISIASEAYIVHVLTNWLAIPGKYHALAWLKKINCTTYSLLILAGKWNRMIVWLWIICQYSNKYIKYTHTHSTDTKLTRILLSPLSYIIIIGLYTWYRWVGMVCWFSGQTLRECQRHFLVQIYVFPGKLPHQVLGGCEGDRNRIFNNSI